jgi:hypothetical protein
MYGVKHFVWIVGQPVMMAGIGEIRKSFARIKICCIL